MDNLDLKEKLWGGIFGVVAIIAAFLEMFVDGIGKLLLPWENGLKKIIYLGNTLGKNSS